MRLLLSREANDDIIEITTWYEKQIGGLGIRFLESLEKSLQHIEEHPFACQVRFSKARTSVLKKFPYQVVYIIKDEIVYVAGIIHTSRNPIVTRKRIRN